MGSVFSSKSMGGGVDCAKKVHSRQCLGSRKSHFLLPEPTCPNLLHFKATATSILPGTHFEPSIWKGLPVGLLGQFRQGAAHCDGLPEFHGPNSNRMVARRACRNFTDELHKNSLHCRLSTSKGRWPLCFRMYMGKERSAVRLADKRYCWSPNR